MKRFLIWAGILASLLGPANAAGTVPGFSLTPQFDTFGKVMPGCKLYVIQAATTQTPQNSYQDSALTIPNPNPLVCDATGRLPVFYLADGVIKFRLTNATGSQQPFIGDNLPVIGASSGGGGGGTVDPTTILATGDIKIRYGTGVLTGFVRQNGRTIGSATSGAAERANADTQALFEYLWNTDPNLTVSTGRGASANADWVANKTIALPDIRGRAIAGSDTMGNSSAGILSTSVCINDTSVLGSVCGSQQRTIASNFLPNVTLTASTSGVVTVNSTIGNIVQGSVTAANNGTAIAINALGAGSGVGAVSSNGFNSMSGTTSSINGGQAQAPFTTIQPTIIMTIYQKL